MGTFKSPSAAHVGYTFFLTGRKLVLLPENVSGVGLKLGYFCNSSLFCACCGGAANVTVLFLEAFLCFLFSWLLVSTGVPASDSCLFSKPGVTFAFRRTLLQLNTLVFPSIHHKNCGCLLYCIYHVHICSLLVTVFRAHCNCAKIIALFQKPSHLWPFADFFCKSFIGRRKSNNGSVFHYCDQKYIWTRSHFPQIISPKMSIQKWFLLLKSLCMISDFLD